MTFKLIDALSNHYPERLGALYIVKAPWIFWGKSDPKILADVPLSCTNTNRHSVLEDVRATRSASHGEENHFRKKEGRPARAH
jgi:hypothetical protein